MFKKNGESFNEYAQQQRVTAPQVKSSLTDRETILIFLSTLKNPYLNHMSSQVTADFSSPIMIGERIKDGLLKWELTDIEAL